MAGFDVLPVYRDLHQFPKGKSRVVLNVKWAEKTGSWAVSASTLRLGRVAPFWRGVPKREVRKSRAVGPHSRHIGAA